MTHAELPRRSGQRTREVQLPVVPSPHVYLARTTACTPPANAGLLLPVTLAQHLGLPQLVQQRLDLGRQFSTPTDATARGGVGGEARVVLRSAGD